MLSAARKELLKDPQEGSDPAGPARPHSSKTARKKRVRNFTADDRAAHRIFERGRREAFKERLNAGHPQTSPASYSDPQRLSKHVIVDEGIARCQALQLTCLGALEDIRALVQERDFLLAEVNGRRHVEGSPLRSAQTVPLHFGDLVRLEEEAGRPSGVQTAITHQPQGHIADPDGPSNDDATGPTTSNSSQDLAAGRESPTTFTGPSLPTTTDPADEAIQDPSWLISDGDFPSATSALRPSPPATSSSTQTAVMNHSLSSGTLGLDANLPLTFDNIGDFPLHEPFHFLDPDPTTSVASQILDVPMDISLAPTSPVYNDMSRSCVNFS
ncbi:hypothetical protein ACJZ2D_013587 [Fusarium nematophilum]